MLHYVCYPLLCACNYITCMLQARYLIFNIIYNYMYIIYNKNIIYIIYSRIHYVYRYNALIIYNFVLFSSPNSPLLSPTHTYVYVQVQTHSLFLRPIYTHNYIQRCTDLTKS